MNYNKYMNWEEIWNKILNFLQTSGLNILKALCLFLIGAIVIKLIVKLIKSSFAKSKMEKIVQGFLCSLIKITLYILLVYMCAQILGVSTSGFLAVISAAGLAISLALQNSLSNLANGIVLLINHPFAQGDFVAIGNIEGTVKAIEMTHTILVSVDNKVLSIPNSTVVSSNITNYNVLGKRKIIFNFNVDYATDLPLAKQIILDVINSNGKAKTDPAPFVSLKTLDDSSLGITANCWVDSEDYWDVFYYVTDKVFNEFKKNKINIPFNQMEVRLRNDVVSAPFDSSPLPERIEKPQKEEKITDPLERVLQKSKIKKQERKKLKTKI